MTDSRRRQANSDACFQQSSLQCRQRFCAEKLRTVRGLNNKSVVYVWLSFKQNRVCSIGSFPYIQQWASHEKPRTLQKRYGRYEEQELSYRKQIASQLRTQYVDGIYNNPVTLKSRLKVTQDH